MEATIIVALIAALVSIASVIANIYIAKKSRQSAIEVLRAKATLEKLGNLDKNIKTVEIEAERLRICGHDLLAFLNRENNGAPDPDSHAEFSRLARRFANQAHEFMDSWADARSDVPREILEHVRVLRHECATPIGEILSRCKRSSNPMHSRQDSQRIVSALERLLALLDAFTYRLSDVRRELNNTTSLE